SRAGSVASIRKNLLRAENYFIEASAAAEVAQAAFETTIRARNDAHSVDAPNYATQRWDAAEMNFSQATQRMEQGSIKYAQRYAEKAELGFREAELEAIKVNYLSETKALLEQADDLRAEKYAPVSFARATGLLASAETELNSNRYDTDRPRSLALDAKHNALHAIYVSQLERKVRARATSLESILLEWETSLRTLGAALDQPIYFDDGEEQAIADLLSATNDLVAQQAQVNQELDDSRAQLKALNAELASLHEQLGGENETIAQLSDLLDRQKRHRQRFATLESMFEDDQASVMRKGNDVIIRMIGLNFDSGAALLKPQHDALLHILEDAISTFPESKVVVEGHTDAFGSDMENLALSQARADSVVSYLLSHMPISPANLSSMGFGESRPAANNETAAGRTRNRRIDVVIYPSW
ncbi:MAG: OmpA family protein, partial [Gammaproteobacteria bacterium]|nr:OmpA family protein [Gammaproteobacteria bacterium]